MPAGSGVLRLKLAGTVITGAVWSTRFTVTLKSALPVFWCESVAVQVTFVVPRGKVLPEAGLQVTGSGPSTLSVALAEKVTIPPPVDSVSAEKSPGTDTTGGVVSLIVTVTEKEAEPVFPCESVALHVTVVGPSGKWPVTKKSPLPLAPEGGSQVAVRGFPLVGSKALTS